MIRHSGARKQCIVNLVVAANGFLWVLLSVVLCEKWLAEFHYVLLFYPTSSVWHCALANSRIPESPREVVAMYREILETGFLAEEPTVSFL